MPIPANVDLDATDISCVSVATRYCVSHDVHDMHVLSCLTRNLPPIPVAKADEKRDEPIAIVCSGPSLAQTCETLRGFKNILTCSGAHNFLIERGIIPTWHMETDPREHKAVFCKTPHKSVMYLIASNCHPKVFDSLAGHDVRIWHVHGHDDPSYYPRGHWAITGGSNVGLRALIMARLLGYVDLHIFGMDCCADQAAVFHSGFHPNEPKEKARLVAKIGDKQFTTTQVFLEYAREFFKERLMIPDAKFTLYGDGLLQALAIKKFSDPAQVQKYQDLAVKRGASVIALTTAQTISSEYAALNRQLHEHNLAYGFGGHRHVDVVLKLYKLLRKNHEFVSILDYGAGKCRLARSLPIPIWNYDPAVPGIDNTPRPADLVVCTDVLEHVEPDFLDATLEDLARCTKAVGFFTIHTGPSGKSLSDGRNTHLIQQNAAWWRARLERWFNVPANGISERLPLLFVIVSPKLK